MIEFSKSPEEKKELQRTQELLGYVQAGADKLLLESAEEKTRRIEEGAEQLLSAIYEVAIDSQPLRASNQIKSSKEQKNTSVESEFVERFLEEHVYKEAL